LLDPRLVDPGSTLINVSAASQLENIPRWGKKYFKGEQMSVLGGAKIY